MPDLPFIQPGETAEQYWKRVGSQPRALAPGESFDINIDYAPGFKAPLPQNDPWRKKLLELAPSWMGIPLGDPEHPQMPAPAPPGGWGVTPNTSIVGLPGGGSGLLKSSGPPPDPAMSPFRQNPDGSWSWRGQPTSPTPIQEWLPGGPPPPYQERKFAPTDYVDPFGTHFGSPGYQGPAPPGVAPGSGPTPVNRLPPQVSAPGLGESIMNMPFLGQGWQDAPYLGQDWQNQPFLGQQWVGGGAPPSGGGGGGGGGGVSGYHFPTTPARFSTGGNIGGSSPFNYSFPTSVVQALNQFMIGQWQNALANRIPGGPALEASSSQRINELLNPPFLFPEVDRRSAELGAALGISGAPASSAIGVKMSDAERLSRIQQGQQYLTAALGRNPPAPVIDPEHFLTRTIYGGIAAPGGAGYLAGGGRGPSYAAPAVSPTSAPTSTASNLAAFLQSLLPTPGYDPRLTNFSGLPSYGPSYEGVGPDYGPPYDPGPDYGPFQEELPPWVPPGLPGFDEFY